MLYILGESKLGRFKSSSIVEEPNNFWPVELNEILTQTRMGSKPRVSHVIVYGIVW